MENELIINKNEETENYDVTSSFYPNLVGTGVSISLALINLGKLMEIEDNRDLSKSVDNFEQIKGMLDFTIPNSFYEIIILKRRKENPDMKHDTKDLKHYFLYGEDDLIKLKPKIVSLCVENNARAYINMNRLSLDGLGLNMISTITSLMMEKNRNLRKLNDTFVLATGNLKTSDTNKWVVDIDTKDNNFLHSVIDWLLNSFKNNTGEVFGVLPSKNGYHIVCNGFNPTLFKIVFPDVSIINKPTALLYV